MAQQQQQASGDHSMAGAWIAGLFIFAGYVIWVTARQYIVSFVFAFNILQAKCINFFLKDPTLNNEIFLMQTLDPKLVDWAQLMEFTAHVGTYSRYPIMVMMLLFGLILYRSDVTLKYRRRHSMNTLREQEQYNWPGIMPVVKEDLVSMDVNSGPWAMAMTPMEFARKYNLLKKSDVLLDNSIPGQEMTAGLKRGDAKRIFTLQLGPAWDGFERCPIHVRALAAVFIARINRDKSAANTILTNLDKSYVAGKLDPGDIHSVIEKYKNTELVQEIISRHAYLLTVMASLLEGARQDGVVPSSEFLWLKPTDRRLWYMCNCVGRQTAYVEVGGPFAHWKAEKAMGRRSRAPMIDEAIKALEIAIREIKLSPKELQELQP
ncbi:MAG TPA: type IVB secretion system coupling complex protein DotM/IcmP [Legionellaceae bacterium]|nr:type IVB secretion system coupling complex protein DotM/IcmP [Legionellaceae bacterium]